MAGKVVGWAFEQGRKRELSPIERYVLVAYGDNAAEDGKCWPDKSEIVEKTGLSQATVYRAIRVLQNHELLSFEKDEKGRDCAYLAVVSRSHGEKDDSQGENGNSQSEKRTNKGTVKNRQKVNGKTVKEHEFTLAAAVVSSFNEIAGTRLSAEANLTPIVMRIRERPELNADHHRKVIEAVFAGPHWWDDPAGIQIVYGNAAIFEKSIELARAAAKKKSTPTFDVNAEARRIRREQGLDT